MVNNKLVTRILLASCVTFLATPGSWQASAALLQAASSNSTADTVLRPADLEELVPKTVFFRGQSAPVQLRNSGGIKFSDGFYLLASLVDTSGYSTGIQAKYQAYLITEVPLNLEGHQLLPGAYGVGFIADHRFVVMDVGAHDLFTVAYERDDALHRPTPLQVIADAKNGGYRFYEGRNYITLKRVK